MAGGMSSKQGVTIAQRVANTRTGAPSPSSSAPPVAAQDEGPTPPAVTHCWYDGPYGRQAALLLQWRQRAGTWSGRIAVSVPDADGWALVEMWVEAGMLASPEPPPRPR